MLKRVLLSVAVILFVSAVAFAQPPIGAASGSIYQYQNFIVGDLLHPSASGLSSIVTVSHGENALSIQSLQINNEQSVPGSYDPINLPLWWNTPDPKTKANQEQYADIFQKTWAESDCGIITTSAFISAGGVQDQFIGYADDLKYQGQTLGLAADQLLVSTGNAEGTSINDVDDMSQYQIGQNGAGSMYEYSYIDAFQMGDIDGKSNTTVSAVNSMIASTTQNQLVYGNVYDIDP
jgi:hypothetical protein